MLLNYLLYLDCSLNSLNKIVNNKRTKFLRRFFSLKWKNDSKNNDINITERKRPYSVNDMDNESVLRRNSELYGAMDIKLIKQIKMAEINEIEMEYCTLSEETTKLDPNKHLINSTKDKDKSCSVNEETGKSVFQQELILDRQYHTLALDKGLYNEIVESQKRLLRYIPEDDVILKKMLYLIVVLQNVSKYNKSEIKRTLEMISSIRDVRGKTEKEKVKSKEIQGKVDQKLNSANKNISEVTTKLSNLAKIMSSSSVGLSSNLLNCKCVYEINCDLFLIINDISKDIERKSKIKSTCMNHLLNKGSKKMRNMLTINDIAVYNISRYICTTIKKGILD